MKRTIKLANDRHISPMSSHILFIGSDKLNTRYRPIHNTKQKTIIHQVTTMLATSKMSYFQVITTC